MTINAFITTAAVLLCSAMAVAQEPERPRPRNQEEMLELGEANRKTLLLRALIADGASTDAAFLELRKERYVTLQTLEQIVLSKQRDVDANSARLHAIQLLGEYHEGANLLINYLSLRVPTKKSRKGPLAEYPVAQALIENGRPAVTGLLRRVNSNTSDGWLILVAYVIHGVDGQELGLCRLQIAQREHEKRLRAEAEKAGREYEPDGRTANLQRLVELLQSHDFSQPPP